MVNPFKDINWNPDTAARKSFGKSLMIGFPIIAAVFGGLGWFKSGTFPQWALYLGVIGFLAGVIFYLIPQIAKPFYLVWFGLAACMGIVISNVLLATFYYTIITATGLIMRAMGRDPMKRKFDRDAKTYWQDAEKGVDPSRYYRQF